MDIVSSGFISIAFSVLTTLIVLFLMLGQYKNKVDTLIALTSEHKFDIKELIKDVAALQSGIDRDRAHGLAQSKSPLSLTDKGKALLLDSHGKDFVDEYKNELISIIKSKAPYTAYDVQELSDDVIKNMSSSHSFNKLKDFAFNNGMKLDDIIFVMSLYLRDLALKELGFDIKDIKD